MSAQNKRPANLAPLSKEAFGSAPQGNYAGGHSLTRPSEVTLVLGGSAGVQAVDELTQRIKQAGHFSSPAGGDGGSEAKTQLHAIVYERNANETVESVEAIRATLTATDNTPITVVHPLVAGAGGAPPELPERSAPHHMQLAFAVPTLTSADALRSHLDDWLKFLATAGERNYTLELALPQGGQGSEAEKLREAVEELLGKAWDASNEQAKQDGSDVLTNGARILIDAFGAPPADLGNSEEISNWNSFIRRLALHPRVFLKLSPIAPTSLLPSAATRPADSHVPASGAASAALHAVKETAGAAVSAAAGLVSKEEDLSRRLRGLLESAVEAFGEERLVWAGHLPAVGAKPDKEGRSEPEAWYEKVREGLADMGLDQGALNKIFARNASQCYLL